MYDDDIYYKSHVVLLEPYIIFYDIIDDDIRGFKASNQCLQLRKCKDMNVYTTRKSLNRNQF